MNLATRKNDHPSLDIVESHGSQLYGKKIVLCVAGSVAAYKSIELARLLMRHGADVRCVASNAVTKLIQPDYFKWATGNNVITKLTGELEHIRLADYGQSDLIIVYPATANTLGKLANGIDDTPVSTVLTVGFGSKIPILMCLAMHESMYGNAAVQKNMGFLRKRIRFLEPKMIEKKAKAPEPQDVLEHTLKQFGHSSVLDKKRVLIVAGPTIEYIDPIRVITNQSTGQTGILLAKDMHAAGAKVTLVYGPGCVPPPKKIKCIPVKTSAQMRKAIKKELEKKFHVVIMAAAISDYTIDKTSKTKIKSDKKNISLKLVKTPKIIDEIKEIQPSTFLVGFKAETDVSKKRLEDIAVQKLVQTNADLIIANDIGVRYTKNPKSNKVFMASKDSKSWSKQQSKEKISKLIIKKIEGLMYND